MNDEAIRETALTLRKLFRSTPKTMRGVQKQMTRLRPQLLATLVNAGPAEMRDQPELTAALATLAEAGHREFLTSSDGSVVDDLTRWDEIVHRYLLLCDVANMGRKLWRAGT